MRDLRFERTWSEVDRDRVCRSGRGLQGAVSRVLVLQKVVALASKEDAYTPLAFYLSLHSIVPCTYTAYQPRGREEILALAQVRGGIRFIDVARESIGF